VLPKHRERERARVLRAHGASLRAIAAELDVALGSVSVWVRDVPTTRTFLKQAGASRATFAGLSRLPMWHGTEVRRCYRCERLLPDVAFGRANEGRQYRCRRCCRDYFAARGDVHRQQSGEALRRRRLRAKAHVLEYLSSRACLDCGESDPIVLEFDHVGEKHADISVLAHDGVRTEVLDREMALCEVVCACCHRRRTTRRQGPTAQSKNPLRRRNAAYIRSILAKSACVDCGEADACILDFDHIGEKTYNVSRLVYRDASLARIDREIEQCEVRCANCHRRQTSARGQHFRFRSA
jgi:hypothetical protein